MDVKQLIKILNNYDGDKIVVMNDGAGWTNINTLREEGDTIHIVEDKHNIFD